MPVPSTLLARKGHADQESFLAAILPLSLGTNKQEPHGSGPNPQTFLISHYQAPGNERALPNSFKYVAPETHLSAREIYSEHAA